MLLVYGMSTAIVDDEPGRAVLLRTLVSVAWQTAARTTSAKLAIIDFISLCTTLQMRIWRGYATISSIFLFASFLIHFDLYNPIRQDVYLDLSQRFLLQGYNSVGLVHLAVWEMYSDTESDVLLLAK